MSAPYSFPPLNGLRAFEVAARHMSFQNGAEELNVTPGAISQQIKKLEDILQTPLFHREGRAVSLTEAGNFYQASAQVLSVSMKPFNWSGKAAPTTT